MAERNISEIERIKEALNLDLISRLSKLVVLRGSPVTPADFPNLDWATNERSSLSTTASSGTGPVSKETQLGFYDLQLPCATTNARHDRKLSLVLDLDQTLVHAVKLSELLADVIRSPSNNHIEEFLIGTVLQTDNPNFVHAFSSRIQFNSPGAHQGDAGEQRQLLVTRLEGEMYFIKLRPGLRQFLHDLAEKYELHIYTKANRNYLNFLINELDPLGKLFTSAVARDDSPDLDTDLKILDRVCCRDMKEVVIFDDRVDVWNETPANVIRAQPYNFLNLKKFAVIRALAEIIDGSKDVNGTNTSNAFDFDAHLYYMKDVLISIFDEYVAKSKTSAPLSAPAIISRIKKSVLAGVSVQFTGFTDTNALAKDAEEFGADSSPSTGSPNGSESGSTTFVLVAAKNTKKANDAKKESPKTRVVHWSWMEHVRATWKSPSCSVFGISKFRLDEGGVYAPVDNWEVAWLAANADTLDNRSDKGTVASSLRDGKRRKKDVPGQ